MAISGKRHARFLVVYGPAGFVTQIMNWRRREPKLLSPTACMPRRIKIQDIRNKLENKKVLFKSEIYI